MMKSIRQLVSQLHFMQEVKCDVLFYSISVSHSDPCRRRGPLTCARQRKLNFHTCFACERIMEHELAVPADRLRKRHDCQGDCQNICCVGGRHCSSQAIKSDLQSTVRQGSYRHNMTTVWRIQPISGLECAMQGGLSAFFALWGTHSTTVGLIKVDKTDWTSLDSNSSYLFI